MVRFRIVSLMDGPIPIGGSGHHPIVVECAFLLERELRGGRRSEAVRERQSVEDPRHSADSWTEWIARPLDAQILRVQQCFEFVLFQGSPSATRILERQPVERLRSQRN